MIVPDLLNDPDLVDDLPFTQASPTTGPSASTTLQTSRTAPLKTRTPDKTLTRTRPKESQKELVKVKLDTIVEPTPPYEEPKRIGRIPVPEFGIIMGLVGALVGLGFWVWYLHRTKRKGRGKGLSGEDRELSYTQADEQIQYPEPSYKPDTGGEPEDWDGSTLGSDA